MKLVLVLTLALVLGGVALVATASPAAACTPYSVCALQHDLKCAQAADDAVEKVDCIDLM